MYLSFNHNLEVMINTTSVEKCLELDVVTYMYTFTERVLMKAYITEKKSRFA